MGQDGRRSSADEPAVQPWAEGPAAILRALAVDAQHGLDEKEVARRRHRYGVNDAPALKKADMGIAMGRGGTQVAREAAGMVLRDDAFGSIVAALAPGRIIFGNIRAVVVYLISCNVSEVLIVALASLVNAPLPIQPLQILFLNLVTDVFPALALGVGEGPPDVLRSGVQPAAALCARGRAGMTSARRSFRPAGVDIACVPRLPRWLRQPRHPDRADHQAPHSRVRSRREMYLGSAS